MTTVMHRIILLMLLSPALVFADVNSPAEATVVAAIETYWDARNSNDHKAVAAMESETGMMNTTSDGSFHKPIARASAEDWKRHMAGTKQGSVRVFYTEATEISEGVVYARYYGEGVVGKEDDLSPYRTRITNVWVKEPDGEWRIKAMHFSAANFGGTHKTQRLDFED